MKSEIVKLNDIVSISKGKKHSETDVVTNSHNYIQIEDLHRVSQPKYTVEVGTNVNANDLVIAWDGANAGKVGVGFVGMIGSTLARLRPTTNRVNSRYLYWFLESNFEKIKSQRTGATIPHVNGATLREFQIPLPTLSVQQQIADILDKADSLRQKDQQLLQKYDELTQAIFYDLFGDPVRNEKGWVIAELGSLQKAKSQNGLYVPIENYVSEGGIEMVHMSDLFYGYVTTGNLKRVKITDELVNKYGLDENCILVARRSLNYEGAAKPCLILKSCKKLVYESSMIRIIPDRSKLTPLYLYHFLNNQRARTYYVLKYVTKSTISGINNENLNKIKIPVPSIEIQEKFCGLISELNKSIIISRSNLSSILFQTLIQKAFNGDLIV